MEAIFSSKLYKTSTRKQKIAAALNDPINLELVQQIGDYIGRPEEVHPATHKYSDSEIHQKVPDSSEPERSVEIDVNVPKPRTQFVDNSGPDVDFQEVSQTGTEESSTDDVSQDDNAISKGEPDVVPEISYPTNENAAASVSVESSKIEGATTSYTPSVVDPSGTLRIDAEVIKGTLDVREDTAGVSRISVKDNELWIHYKDSVNLNSIMEPVIYVLNAAGFTYLEFNRLARSSNAIVFEILCIPEQVKPITER